MIASWWWAKPWEQWRIYVRESFVLGESASKKEDAT